ncbi:hypothetical protein [Brevundimonas sp. GCM10030266]|uniref:hypothetical protein n=1 Tax=Brevundimonas sp. GCM10030266 TaxID=3273386 RepID=UPI003624040E
MSGIVASTLVGVSVVACAPPRQPVDLEIDLGATSGRRCVVIYELQRRAPFGMATYWPVHLEEADNAGRLRVSKPLCPNLKVGALGGAEEVIKHEGGRKVVVLDGDAVDAPCEAPRLSEEIFLLEQQLRDPDPVRCEQ